MDLEQKYKKEIGFDVGKIHDTGTTYYSDDYVKWLEKQVQELRKHDVVERSEQLVCDCVKCKPFHNESTGYRQHKFCVKNKAN